MNAELIDEITEELKIELKDEPNLDDQLLTSKVKSAYREVKAARKYPTFYNDAMIEKDMENFYSQIKALTMYDYLKIGAEGQDQYSADGENIKYSDRNAIFDGVLPIARV